jgi:hypothetical protein|tara:strand:+ start:53 stop:166 length:114 start_codon:yes stop_codon:yes gene_type:complete
LLLVAVALVIFKQVVVVLEDLEKEKILQLVHHIQLHL